MQHASNRLNTNRVGPASRLANDAAFPILLEPLRSGCHALLTNGRADAGRAGAGAITVEVLVHLVDNQGAVGASGVGQGGHGGGCPAGNPGPCSGVGVSLDKDVLCGGARSPDTIDSGLVELAHEGVVHVMVFVVCVEDDQAVGGKASCYRLPPCLEPRCVADDIAIVSA